MSPAPAVLLLAGGAASLHPAVSAAAALALGAAIGLTVGNPHRAHTQKIATRLLQACIVGIGFGMSFAVIVSVGAAGLVQTAAVVLGALAAGLALGRALRVDGEVSLLISSGTGICGGSAIAAVGSAIRARAETMSIALAVVFVLNAVALYAFPFIGRALALTDAQFGTWAALAIHDTSSVVGAASVYGDAALERATVLKLARALWIVPLALAAAFYARRASPDTAVATGTRSIHGADAVGLPADGVRAGRAGAGGVAAGTDAVGTASTATSHGPRGAVPWFIVLFVCAAVVRSVSPGAALPVLDGVSRTARLALPLVLFLIGAGLTRTTLRTVGLVPMVQAGLLWILVAAATLAAVTLLPAL